MFSFSKQKREFEYLHGNIVIIILRVGSIRLLGSYFRCDLPSITVFSAQRISISKNEFMLRNV